jgi:hypothetical protein
VTATASWATQVGIVGALRSASAVTNLLAAQADGSSSVVDEVRESLEYPYLVVGEGSEREELFFGQGGHVVTVELYIYTQDGSTTTASTGSAGYKRGLAIADAALAVLQDGSSLSVTGHDVVMVNQNDDWGKERLVDGITRCVRPLLEITLEDQS